MKKVKTLKPFMDLKEDVAREEGDIFTASEDRADYLAGLGLVKVEETETEAEEAEEAETEVEEAEEPKTKKTKKK